MLKPKVNAETLQIIMDLDVSRLLMLNKEPIVIGNQLSRNYAYVHEQSVLIARELEQESRRHPIEIAVYDTLHYYYNLCIDLLQRYQKVDRELDFDF